MFLPFLFDEGGGGGGTPPEQLDQAFAADDARIGFSDYAGVLTRTSTASYITRPIPHSSGFQHCAPCSRIRAGVEGAGVLRFTLTYTTEMTRADTFFPMGVILVDGAVAGTFTSPNAYNVGATVHVDVAVSSANSVVELLLPICAAVRLAGGAHSAGVTVKAPPPRPTKRLVITGDSRGHGLQMPRPDQVWGFLLAQRIGMQCVIIANGGDQIDNLDGAKIAEAQPALVICLVGFNNFYPNGDSPARLRALLASVIANYQGLSSAPWLQMTDLWSSSDADVGTGAYAGNIPTLEQVREACRGAAADRGVGVQEGRGQGMPAGFDDGVHPSKLAEAQAISSTTFVRVSQLGYLV